MKWIKRITATATILFIIVFATVVITGSNAPVKTDFELCGAWGTDHSSEYNTLVLNQDGTFLLEMELPDLKESGTWEIQDKVFKMGETEQKYREIILTTKRGEMSLNVMENYRNSGQRVIKGPQGDNLGPLAMKVWTLKGKQKESSVLQTQASVGATVKKVSEDSVATVPETVLIPSGPRETVESYFKDFQKGDYEAMEKYCPANRIKEYRQQSSDEKKAFEDMAERFRALEISVGDGVINGDKATVPVEMCDSQKCSTSSINLVEESSGWKFK